MAYAELEPFGPLQDDARAGMVSSVVANTARDPKKQRRPFEPADFFPALEGGKRQRQQSWQEQLQIVEMLNAALGGQDLRDRD